MDMEKLLKILGMTGSSHDSEALVALRMAQRLMAAEGKTWKDLIGVQPQAQPKQQRPRQWWEDPAQQHQWDGGWGSQQKQWDDVKRAAEAAQRAQKEAAARKREEEAREWGPTNDDIAMKHECLRMLDECPALLTEWEVDFLVSFEDRPDHWSITEKQRAVFHKLRARFREHRK